MTTDEAKKKWCPFIRFQIGPNDSTWQGNGYTNRADFLNEKTCLCIADHCIAWRTEKLPVKNYEGRTVDYKEDGRCGMVPS